MGAAMLSAAQLRGPDVFSPYLWWDFTNRHDMPPGSTYTRASTKYQWNPNTSQYEPYASGVFAPDYDPLTGECRGFRSETAATNLLLWSADFSNAAWTTNLSTKVGGVSGIIAGNSAMNVSTSTPSGSLSQIVGTFSGNAETLCMLIEQGSGATCGLSLFNATLPAHSTFAQLTFSTGAVSVVGGSGTADAIKLLDVGPNGGKVFLFWITGTGISGNARRAYIYPTFTAGTGNAYLHHAQLVAGTRVSSPIVTGAASAARVADVMSILTLPAWFNQAQYTMFAEVEFEQVPDSLTYVLAVTDGTSNEMVFNYTTGVGGACITAVYDGAALVGAATAGNVLTTGVNKIAASVATNSLQTAKGGAAGVADNTLTMPTVTLIRIASSASGVSGQLNGWIRRIGIAPVTQTTDQLQALTV